MEGRKGRDGMGHITDSGTNSNRSNRYQQSASHTCVSYQNYQLNQHIQTIGNCITFRKHKMHFLSLIFVTSCVQNAKYDRRILKIHISDWMIWLWERPDHRVFFESKPNDLIHPSPTRSILFFISSSKLFTFTISSSWKDFLKNVKRSNFHEINPYRESVK